MIFWPDCAIASISRSSSHHAARNVSRELVPSREDRVETAVFAGRLSFVQLSFDNAITRSVQGRVTNTLHFLDAKLLERELLEKPKTHCL